MKMGSHAKHTKGRETVEKVRGNRQASLEPSASRRREPVESCRPKDIRPRYYIPHF